MQDRDAQEARDQDDAELDSGADRQDDDRHDAAPERDSAERDDDGDEDGEGFDALPAKTKAELRRLRKENQRLRKSTTATKTERDQAKAIVDAITKALGGDSKAAEDPEALAARLTEKDRELRTMRTERAAERAIRKHGGDVDALLDSRSFAEKLAKLDPSDKDFDDDLDDLVTSALESNPRYRQRKVSGAGEHGGKAAKGRPKNLREAFARRAASR